MVDTTLNALQPKVFSKNGWQRNALIFSAMMLAGMTTAFAQATFNVSGFCTLYTWLKLAAGVTAVIAIVFIAIQNMIGKSDLVEKLVMGVGISCIVIVSAVALVNSMGLTVGCT